jgi:Flp pilus assembly protein TadD
MQPSSYETLVQALESNDPEQLKDAAKKCQAILRNNPGNAAFLHLMGSIEFQLGHVAQASKWIKKVLAIKPDSAELYYVLAEMLSTQEKYAEAIIAFKRSIALKPDYAKALYGLGIVFERRSEDANAIQAYDDALAINPNYPEVLNNLGVILQKKGEPAKAANCFTRAIAARPDYPFPLNNLGLIWFSMGSVDAAAELYRRALAIKPDYPEALNNLGMIFNDRGAFAESTSLYEKALALQPDYPDALNNLGIIRLHQGAFTDSISFFNRALALQPKHSEAHNNLGNALKNEGNLTEAITAYEKAIALKGDNPDYHNNLAMALLAAGRFEEGWREYEWRWKTKQFVNAQKDTGKPLWHGEAAEGRVLLIRAEQGLGDTLQFCRYAPLAAARGLRVKLEVQPALVKLLGSIKGVEQVIAQGQPLPDGDLYCPMMSLPAALNTRLETIPADVPYLAVSDANVNSWRSRLSDDNNSKLKVGLVWAGKPRFNSPDLVAADQRRSMAPDVLAPLMDISGIRFYSLQKGGPPAPREFGLTDLMDQCDDFIDTAALVMNLDLIISVDTAVAHLAGALGKPVWLLNRFDTCWRWLQTREDSPWYPTLRLFRQPSSGDWKSVVSRVRNELHNVLTTR